LGYAWRLYNGKTLADGVLKNEPIFGPFLDRRA